MKYRMREKEKAFNLHYNETTKYFMGFPYIYDKKKQNMIYS